MRTAAVLVYFLFGALITLLIFGFNSPILPNFQINYSLPGSQADWLTAVGTIGATTVALTVAIFGKSLAGWFYKSNIQIVNSIENIQNQQGQTRLLFENRGNAIAEDVEVYVSKIVDGGHARYDFLPVPLSWTHDGRPRRNFHPNQFGYIDLCMRDDIQNNQIPRLVLVAGAGVGTYENIYAGKTELSLVIFQKSGKTKKYQVFLRWKSGEPYAKVEKITETN